MSEDDRAHFARIDAAKRAERTERILEANAEHPVAKMIDGLELGHAGGSSADLETMLDRRALGQAELARRGRRCGRRTVDG